MKAHLKGYVDQLAGIYAVERSFLRGNAASHARAVGQQIHDLHGYQAMITVCDALRQVAGGVAARELEVKWGGIGEWQS